MVGPALVIGMGFGFGAGLCEQLVEFGEHGPVARVGLLAYETADRLVGRADLPAHVLDAFIDAFEFERTWLSSTLGSPSK